MTATSLRHKLLGTLRQQRASADYDAQNWKLTAERRAFCRRVRDEIDVELARRQTLTMVAEAERTD